MGVLTAIRLNVLRIIIMRKSSTKQNVVKMLNIKNMQTKLEYRNAKSHELIKCCNWDLLDKIIKIKIVEFDLILQMTKHVLMFQNISQSDEWYLPFLWNQ